MPSPSTPKDWIDTSKLNRDLHRFFGTSKNELSRFGSTVNQTFEAFVFASVVGWYQGRGWSVRFENPGPPDAKGRRPLRLKFSTRGRPQNYTYAVCRKAGEDIQVRHQLRVATKAYRPSQKNTANVVLDVAVVVDQDLTAFGSYDQIENRHLVTFGEAKHMSAFAELLAGFLGVVHELQPDRLRRRRFKKSRLAKRMRPPSHLSPFIFVSGFLYQTAEGIKQTIERRGYDVDIYSRTSQLTPAITVSGVGSSS